jgi:hypothetical protein
MYRRNFLQLIRLRVIELFFFNLDYDISLKSFDITILIEIENE